jgi:hypothetical protein
MMVPGMSNVVVMVRGAQGAVTKDSTAKSSVDGADRGASEAEVTVLFPRAKTNAGSWTKPQKAVGDAARDAKKQDDDSDTAGGRNVFGSLVASVEQKLTRQEDQPSSTGQTEADVDATRVSMNPAPQLMGRGKLVDALQNFKEKPVFDDDESGQFSARVIKSTPTADSDVVSSSGTKAVATSGVKGSLTFNSRDPSTADHQILAGSDRGQPNELISVKSANGAFQVPKFSTGKADSAPSVAATTTPSAFSPVTQEHVGDSIDTEKAVSTTKKEPASPNTELADASHSHVAQVSYPVGSEGKLLSPVAQIVENIRTAVPPTPLVARDISAIPVPVKTLEVQLQHEGLGTVTVSLKTEQGKLKVEISTKLQSTRQELERNSVELVSGLQRVDPKFKAADINFIDQNQDTTPDNAGQTSGNGGERRGTPENLSGFGSNGGRDANQPSANARPSGHGLHRHEHKRTVGELPSRLVRADGIYL